MFPPGHSRANGELLIAGSSAGELAAAYGTPLLALDYDVLDAAIASFTDACGPHRIEIAYAGKALLLVALARHLKHTTMQLDVCSLGELAAAERAGFPAERMTLHGCGKTAGEIDAAFQGRVGRIVVDNLDELRRLAAHDAAERALPTVLRINTGIEAHTHEFVATSGEKTKFGFDPAALSCAVEIVANARHLQFLGLHSHIGSQIYEQAAFTANALMLMERAAFCSASGLHCGIIVAGGGFGVRMRPDQTESLDLSATMCAIQDTVRDGAQRLRLPMPKIGIEPGRGLIAQAGTSLYSVMAVKTEFGRPYAIVDGGVFENPRPALYGAHHHTICASREGESFADTVVCGRSCENDHLAQALLPSDLRAGELLAMCVTGAYTYSMASNYNRFTRPAVAAVRGGAHSLIARQESVEDVLRMDCDA